MPGKQGFPADLPDPRDDASRKLDAVGVRRQVEHLVRMRDDPDYRDLVTGVVLDRHLRDSTLPQIEQIARTGLAGLIVSADSVVMPGTARGFVQGAARPGLVRHDVPAGDRPHGIGRFVHDHREDATPPSVNHVPLLSGVMKGPGGPEPSPGGARTFPTGATGGTGVVVAVVDSGVSAERRPDGYLAMPVNQEDLDPLDNYPLDGLLDDGAGHGAFVTGVVEQVAPGTTVHVHRVDLSGGMTTDVQLADAIREATADPEVRIVNVSLGTETVDGSPPPAMAAVIEDLGRRAEPPLVVCAAGNNGTSERVWPAAFASLRDPETGEPAFRHVVAVGALTAVAEKASLGEPAAWSTRGNWVACSTVGEGVVSTYVVGREAPGYEAADGTVVGDPDPDTYGPGSWAVWTGTSFTAPQVTAALAHWCGEHPGQSPQDALAALLASGTDEGDGYGVRLTILPGTPI